MEFFYYLVPFAVAELLTWLIKPSWWGVAMIFAGVIFLWNWLWGDDSLRNKRNGLVFVGAGALLLIGTFLLAKNLGLSLSEFQEIGKGVPRQDGRMLYHTMPRLGVGFLLYGLIIVTLAVTRKRPDEFY